MKITRDYLETLGADCEELSFFDMEWPQGAEVTIDNCRRAAAIELSLTWLAARAFKIAAWTRYMSLLGPKGQGRAEAFYTVWHECQRSLK